MDAIVSVGWTHKINEKQAEIYKSRAKLWQFTQLISSGFASTGGLATLHWPNNIAKYLTVFFALLGFISAGILKAYNFDALSSECKNYANNQFILRERLISLAFELTYSNDIESINRHWTELNEARLQHSEGAPMTSNKACKQASYQLKNRNDNKRDEDYYLFITQELWERLNAIK